MKDATPTSDDFVLKLTPSEQAVLDQLKFDVPVLEIDDAQSNINHEDLDWKPFRLTWRLMSLSFSPVVTVTSLSLVLSFLFLLLFPANDHLAPTAALALNVSPTDPEATPKGAMTKATSSKRPPELAATSPMPALAAPPDEAPPTVPAAPRPPAPDRPPTRATRVPAPPPEEAVPTVATPPGDSAPDTAPAVAMPDPAASPAEPRASTVEVLALLARGDSLFGVGDVTSARLYYHRAADAGDAMAALRLGETYDPLFLELAHLNGVRGDPAVAKRWYRRARDLGNAEAESLLNK